MSASYDLTKLGPKAFEHLVNFLVLKTLGAGSTGFGPGADGGRDGYFEGTAPYPSEKDNWSGIWYIQSKYHAPHLTKNPQEWLIEQVKLEIDAFSSKSREVPDNFILATNIDPSGVAKNGSFDKANKLVKGLAARAGKKINFHIWGGSKIIALLAHHKEASEYYAHFLTPGHVISLMYDHLRDLSADVQTIINYLVINQFGEHQYMKLDQAGSSSDNRPGIHDLFIDLPFLVEKSNDSGHLLASLVATASQCHRYSLRKTYPRNWASWSTSAKRARALVIKGGPGQGKSTAGQYLSQIQRAALILNGGNIRVIDKTAQRAQEIAAAAKDAGFWPEQPRIPIAIELKEFAHWFGERVDSDAINVLAFVAQKIQKKLGQSVSPSTLSRALSHQSWLIIFDGLDEVPNDVKDAIAKEIIYFTNELLVSLDADVLTICTSRPQGYSGQFSDLDGPVLQLAKLDPASALKCAKPVVGLDRTPEEQERSMEILKAALASESVQELMTTPLQAHIMAVVVRDGGRPPERRWQLFDNFYQVMKKRESLKNFPNPRIAKLLREDDRLLRVVHSRLGFVLHARAEQSEGAETHLNRKEFETIVTQAVRQMEEPNDVDSTVAALMEATTERLVLVSTPENGEQVKFDIRQLQEFFAAEFIYQDVSVDELGRRLAIICGDAHWREVMHFLLSGLFEAGRTGEIAVAISALDFSNNGEDEEFANLYRRRMARGALLAARLLAEGVLEQDKRRRQQLRGVLRPITAVMEEDIYEMLEQINPQASRIWLIDFMLGMLEEAKPFENIASLVVLGRILPNDHIKTNYLVDAFLGMPIPVLDLVIQAWLTPENEERYPRARHNSPLLSIWAMMALIRLMSSAASVQLDQNPLHALTARIIGSKQIGAVIAKTNINDTEKSLLQFVGNNDDTFNSRGDPEAKNSIDYGILIGRHHEKDWVTTNSAIPAVIRRVSTSKPTQGILEVIRLLCIFVCSRKLSDLNKAIEAGGDQFMDVLRTLSNDLTKYIPMHRYRPIIYCNYEFEDAANVSPVFDISSKPGRRPAYDYIIGNNDLTREAWRAFIEDAPYIALRFWFDADSSPRRMPEWVYDADNTEEVMLAIERFPVVALSFALSWGKLINANDNYRARLCKIASEADGIYGRHYWGADIEKCTLNMSKDASIIRLIAPAIVRAIEGSVNLRYRTKQKRTLEECLEGFEINIADVVEVFQNTSSAPGDRAAALAWLLLIDCKAKKELSPEISAGLLSKTVEFFQQKADCCLLLVVLHWLETRYSDSNPGIPELLGQLLEIFKCNSKPLIEIHKFLSGWRERSAEPVQRSGVAEKWLAYSWEY